VKRLAVLLLAGVALGAPAVAQARVKVDLMVVGKSRVLAGPQRVTLKPRTAKVGGKRCSIGTATPLSALASTRLRFRLTDYGVCSRRPADAGSLYVKSVAGERAKGSDGWVYKVGRRAGSGGAADPAGPFGTGRKLRTGDRVLWFWCVKDRADSCQRTLEATAGAASAGSPLRVTVRGYDDAGKGVAVAGATVRLGGASAVTGADGVASLTAPPAGRYRLRAEKPGTVPSFPSKVTVR
jgi:hypothetical protein